MAKRPNNSEGKQKRQAQNPIPAAQNEDVEFASEFDAADAKAAERAKAANERAKKQR
ncbi:YfhD family protein [Guptibacillus hwajinpoensis]|uniref:YfhD family protein n=1 Tax=Guptibacillus hwajinpoensis TaxID=208199 RepID=UPI00128CA609|nr:YfhD family protein [Alkalihalobacillus macyae]MDP4552267.1 YfhD family protein [Alkalihalobacillus macyae]